MNKKGIIEFMETFIVIFVIFIIIGLGLFFFMKLSKASTTETIQETCMLSSHQMLASVLDMPDIQCSSKTGLKDCVDTAKLLYFAGSKKANQTGQGPCKKKIVFKQIYPVPEPRFNGTECDFNRMTSKDFPANCGQWTVTVPKKKDTRGKDERVTYAPVSLYYPHNKQYGLGKLIITTYTIS